jgi:hypothetical protein
MPLAEKSARLTPMPRQNADFTKHNIDIMSPCSTAPRPQSRKYLPRSATINSGLGHLRHTAPPAGLGGMISPARVRSDIPDSCQGLHSCRKNHSLIIRQRRFIVDMHPTGVLSIDSALMAREELCAQLGVLTVWAIYYVDAFIIVLNIFFKIK